MKTKAERKGWRAGSSSLPPGVSLEDVNKARDRLMKILNNGHVLSAEEEILLYQAYLLCHRIVAFQNHDTQELNRLSIELADYEKEIREAGLNVLSQNLYISRIVANNQDELLELCESLERKILKE